MKKKRILSALLAVFLFANLFLVPVHAEPEDSTAGTEETGAVPTLPPTGAAITGDASISNGPHSIEAQVPLMERTDVTVNAKAALLFEVDTETMLYSYNPDDKLYPASLTKVMTCLVAVELCTDMNEVITVPKEVMDRVDPSGSGMDLVTDEQLTMEQLLYGLMVESANDAAMVIANHLCGSEEAFVQKMNEKAREIGCQQTHFMNVHGLHHEEHYTTARDMARILLAAIDNEQFYKFFTTSYIVIPATNKSAQREIITTNFMMSKEVTEVYYDTRVVGGKTGFTTPAGRCLVTLSESGGMRLISVVMGAQLVTHPDDVYTVISYGNFEETKKLINHAFRNYMPAQVLSPSQTLGQFDVAYGTVDTHGQVRGTVDTVVPDGSDLSAVRYEYIIDEGVLTAPLEAGTSIGIVRVWYMTKCLAQQELYAASSVEKDIPSTVPSGGNGSASPVNGNPGIWHIVLILILILLGLIAAMLIAGYIRGAILQAKRAKRRKNRRRSR